ncbi:hypothetical protein [Flavobacterium sp. '19STA2R22 D10 B1']|uniref:hypothetical protein n=1 Tax=Flavobacterium aerium TaxID=3037261 RepID=UPI00278BEC85|nr:hypothetical protein [Flavobacterium sp. '19STA2R22 D10 B1']
MKKASCLLLFIVMLSSCNQISKENENKKAVDTIKSVDVEKTVKDSVQPHDTFNETVENVEEKLKSFIPTGYDAINVTYGNLNLDGSKDAILVLRKTTEETTSNNAENKPDKRSLLVLLGQKDGAFQLVYKNDNAVECIDCGGMFGDPFTGITIKEGYFSIEHGVSGGVHWEKVTTFKYDKTKNNWFLFKDHYINYIMNPGTDPNNKEALVKDQDKLKTIKDFGEIPFEKYNTYSEKGY